MPVPGESGAALTALTEEQRQQALARFGLLGYLCPTPRKGQSSCTERIVPLIPQILSATSRRGCRVSAR